MKLKGITTFCSNGQVHFESGYPCNSRIVQPAHIKGVLDIHPNACADFTPAPERIYLPPLNVPVAYGENYNIKRTTRHYIVQVKVPICETRRETEKRFRTLMPEIVGEITNHKSKII